jgi:oligopeptide transport system substrate-binding protein
MNHFLAKITLFAALLSIGCTKRSNPSESKLRWPLSTEPGLLDPTIADTGIAILILRQISCTLLEYDDNQVLQGADAEYFKWENEGHILKIRLKPHLQWSDKSPLQACHYRDGILRALNSKTPALLAELLFDIEGAPEFKAGKIEEKELGISCNNDSRELEIGVSRPYAWKILHALAFPISAPVRRDRIEKYQSRWMEPASGAAGISCGDYVIQEKKDDSKVVLTRRQDKVADSGPGFNIVEMPIVKESMTSFAMYESGALDVLPEVPTPILQKSAKHSDLKVAPFLATYMIGFSTSQNIMKDVKLRQALRYSVNTAEIPALLGGSEDQAMSWIPPSLLPLRSQLNRNIFDPTKAKALLATSDFFKAPKKIKLQLHYNSGDRHQLIVERLSNTWKTYLGIDVELVPSEWKVLVASLKSKAPDLWRYAWAAVYPDPLFFLEIFASNGPNNFGRWKNSEYDMILSELLETPLSERKEKFWSKLEKAQYILTEGDPALIPIYHYRRNYLVKPHVENLMFDQRGLVRFSKIKRKAK